MSASVLVMAKAPVPGQVKTRLESLLGKEGCARLQAALIGQAVRWADSVAPGRVHLAYAGEPLDHPDVTEAFEQEGADLGERLAAATERVFEQTASEGPLLVIGTDTPTLTRGHATEALNLLAEGHEVCFGPALDGGYYLAGLSCACPELFALPPTEWGGPRVLELSLRAARAARMRPGLMRVERDLDTVEDVRAALEDPKVPEEIAWVLRTARAM